MEKKPIRILHVVTYMGRGGLETMIMNYYRNIDRSKVQFDFLVHRKEEADYDQEIKALGGKIYRMPRLNPFSVRYKKTLKRFFVEHPEYCIVHSHLDCMSGIPLKIAKESGVDFCIAHSHSSNQTKDLKYPLKLYFKRNIAQYADYLFACGEEAGRWMFHDDYFRVLNNAINADQFRYNREKSIHLKKQFDFDGKYVIGHVGRFAPPKNHDFLIDVFYESVKKDDTCVLLLIGKGDLMNDIQDKVCQLGLEDKVRFLGQRSDIADLLQAVDCFVFPSIYEGLPVTLIEAQAAGLPCLISDHVPIECKKTDLVQQIPLEKGASHWAMEILKQKNHKKEDTYQQIAEAHFDIKENAKWLQNFYLSLNS